MPSPESPVRIALLVCVTRAAEQERIQLSLPGRWKRSLRHAANMLSWRLRGDFPFHHWAYTDHAASNSGDSAIREATRQQLARLFAPRPVEFSEFSWRQADATLASVINASCQLLVWSAGAIAHLGPDGRLGAHFDRYLQFLQALTIPAAAYGLGLSSKFGPAPDPATAVPAETRLRLVRFSAGFGLFSVRDSHSLSLLNQIPDLPSPRLVTDPALFLVPEGEAAVSCTGVPIGINFAFHGPHCESLARRFFSVYVESLRRIRSRIAACQYFYFVHSEQEMLLATLLRRSGIDLEILAGPPEYLLAAYKPMAIHIGQMLHSCILASNAGVPTLGLAYDTKHPAFFGSIGASEFCLPPWRWEPETIASQAHRLFEQRAAARIRLNAAIAALNGPQQAFLGDLGAFAARLQS